MEHYVLVAWQFKIPQLTALPTKWIPSLVAKRTPTQEVSLKMSTKHKISRKP